MEAELFAEFKEILGAMLHTTELLASALPVVLWAPQQLYTFCLLQHAWAKLICQHTALAQEKEIMTLPAP